MGRRRAVRSPESQSLQVRRCARPDGIECLWPCHDGAASTHGRRAPPPGRGVGVGEGITHPVSAALSGSRSMRRLSARGRLHPPRRDSSVSESMGARALLAAAACGLGRGSGPESGAAVPLRRSTRAAAVARCAARYVRPGGGRSPTVRRRAYGEGDILDVRLFT